MNKQVNYNHSKIICVAQLIFECILGILIILYVPYTEIDWKAYMQQVQGYMSGIRDYTKLNGDTGPLVYPAGFLYIYSLFYWICDQGQNIRLAQWIFYGIQLTMVALVQSLYSKSKVATPLSFILISCSKRIHSIYTLRLFNDPISLLFMMLSIHFLVQKRWTWSCIWFSLALSIKMNILLFAPGYAFILYQSIGLFASIKYAFLSLVIHALVGFEFLMHAPISYLTRAFDFSRVFLYKWSVNWKFLDESIFYSSWMSKGLLCLHLLVLLMFFKFKWIGRKKSVKEWFINGWNGRLEGFNLDEILSILFTSQFIGIVFARSLHYQFYSWYFYTLPYLLWSTPYWVSMKMLLFFTIEICWNIYPSNSASSLILFTSHLILVYGLLMNSSFLSKTIDNSALSKRRKNKIA